MQQDEWKSIYETYQKPLYLYALSLTGNKHDAEDLVQETFVKAFLSYKNTGSLKYWLVTVLRNEFINHLNRRKKEILDDGEIVQALSAPQPDMLADLIAHEERRALFIAIQSLPTKMKEVLIESVYFRMTDAEIAKLHSTTKENIRKIRSRAKQKLLNQMKEGT